MTILGLATPTGPETQYFVDQAAGDVTAGVQASVDFYSPNRATLVDADEQEYLESVSAFDIYYIDPTTGTPGGVLVELVNSDDLATKTLRRHNAKLNNDTFLTTKFASPEDVAQGLDTRGTEWIVREIINALPMTSANPDVNPKEEYRKLIRILGGGYRYADTDTVNTQAEYDAWLEQNQSSDLEIAKEDMKADWENTVYNPGVADPNKTVEQLADESVVFFTQYGN